MYTGTMMDELFAMVSRAEDNTEAQPQKAAPARVDVHATYTYEFTYDETLLGVA